jgi:hypothetical protein
MLDVADLRGLADAERLLPLNEHLASDSDFDPTAYWPHVLETGQIDGAQYALPVTVAPWITILNADSARSSGIEPPAREDFDRDRLHQTALAMQGGAGVQGREHALGYHRFVDPPTTALPDVDAWPPLYVNVMPAVGELRAGDGSFDALRSTQALDAYIRVLHQVASVPALRMSVTELQTLVPFLRDGEAQMVVDLLANATYITLTRREQGVLRNTLDGGVVLNDLSPREALLQLDALKAGA